MKRILIALLLILNTLAGIGQATQKEYSGNFGTYVKGMLLSLPDDYLTSGKKYPLIISLAGMGEPGPGTYQSLQVLKNVSIARWINLKKIPKTFTVKGKTVSFIIASPQLTTNDRGGKFLHDYIQYMIANYPVDENSVYMAGLSNGGGGVFFQNAVTDDWLHGYAPIGVKEVTAEVPICANLQPLAFPKSASYILNWQVHAWMFVNKGDTYGLYPLMVDWKNTLKADPYTDLYVFNKSGHNAWDDATNPDSLRTAPGLTDKYNIYQWFYLWEKDPVTRITRMRVFDTAVTQPVDTIPKDTVVTNPVDSTLNPPVDTTHSNPDTTVITPIIDLKVNVIYGNVCDATKDRKTITFDMSSTTAMNPLNYYGYSCSLIKGPGGYVGGGVKNKISLCIAKGTRTFRVGATDMKGNLVTKDVIVEVK